MRSPRGIPGPTPSALAPPAIWHGQPAAASPMPALADGSVPPAQIAKLKQAAQDFEAMALGQMLAPMFNTVDIAHSAFGGGSAEAAFRPMLVDAIAKQIAAHGGLGLAAPVYATMLRIQEAAASGRTPGKGTPSKGMQ